MSSIYEYFFANRELTMALGTTTIDFGAYPGSAEATKVITGQTTILAGSSLEAFLRATDSADHTADEHRIEPIKITAGTIVPGTGFTVYAEALQGFVYGVWNLDWVWI